ncbi:hypothetical protein [Amycolatopsis xylanica]|uniref:hypothetical protein n=1 Tax=Amycolatopsis xylanica TaxID=589385 RepID=UPI0015A3771D|nr:hypothetical protein [Amycolatopsis xylanica]
MTGHRDDGFGSKCALIAHITGSSVSNMSHEEDARRAACLETPLERRDQHCEDQEIRQPKKVNGVPRGVGTSLARRGRSSWSSTCSAWPLPL